MSKVSHGINALFHTIGAHANTYMEKPIVYRKIESVIELFDKGTKLLLNEISSLGVFEHI